MSDAKQKVLGLTSLRGGRNGYDPPTAIPDDQCVEALNVDWWAGGLANKRGGHSALSTTFSAGGPFTGIIGSMVRHVPAGDETAAELWAFDSAAVNGRLAGAATWTAPTFVDAVSDAKGIVGTSLGGFLHLFYDSAQNRAHLWDGTRVRRAGLATPDPPTVATLGGAGKTFTRYCRIRTVEISGSNTIRRSEASTAVSISITDDSGIRITRSTLPTNEHETHWEYEASSTSVGPWYLIAQIATATSTYDDSAATIDTTNLSNPVGVNTPPPSAKFAVTDDTRNFMAGCYETSGGFTTARNNAVWWTPVIGDRDVGDTERIPTANRIGLEDVPTGVGGPIQGLVFVFAYRRIWKFVPTGIDTLPYQKFSIRKDLGCIRHQTICVGEDENGAPALYFLAARGPYRIGAMGIQFLGLDIDDLWEGVNLAASNTVAHAVYHADKHQVWFYIATGSNNDPDTRLVFDVKEGRPEGGSAVRRGWAKHVPASAARCSVIFSSTVGASMSAALKPYVGITTNNTIWKCDTGTDDAGAAFQAYIDTKEYGEIGKNHAVREGVLIAEAASGVTITVTPKGDNGLQDGQAGTALLTASGSETRVNKRLEGMQHAGAGTFRFRIGDASAVANAWTIDAMTSHVTVQEDRG